MFKQTKIKLAILKLALIAAWLSVPLVTLAQSETAYDLLNAVNDLRALHGLEPYQIDPWLMAYAQEHSEYQAARGAGTHRHSDGSLPQDIGLQENVASGDVGIVTVAVVVYQIWVDWGHRHILVDYPSGEIGAGLALGENGQVYYTVNIRPGVEAATVTEQPGPSPTYALLITSTPDETGSIYHIVKAGETLWGIAISYGVTMNEIRQLNGMADDSTIIRVGQRLLIRPAHLVTPDLLEETTIPPTQSQIEVPALSTGTEAPSDTKTPPRAITLFPSQTITIEPENQQADRSLEDKSISLIAILVLPVIGLLIVVVFGVRKSRRDITHDK
jgi:LysM repeat protein